MNGQNKTYKYQLDKSSRKFRCPECGQKTLVKFTDHKGLYVEGDFGRCDRENNCKYYKYVPDNTQIDAVFVDPKKIIYPNGVHATKLKDLSSPFHIYCQNYGITEAFLSEMKVGSDGRHTIFGLFNQDDKCLNVKYIPYGDNGDRLRGEKDYPFYLSAKNEKEIYSRCLYGLHLFNSEQHTIIVESEKSAILGKHFYPDYNWLATGGNNGAKWEMMTFLLKEKNPIIYLSDNDDAGTSNKVIKWLEKINEFTKNVIIQNPFEGLAQGYDVADWIRDNKKNITEDLYSDLNIDIESINIKKFQSIEINFGFNPIQRETAIKLNQVNVLSVGNGMLLIAPPGTGKSQVCESICAGFINPECDSLGFDVRLNEGLKLCYIDGERTHPDAKRGFERIARRAKLDLNPDLRIGDRMRDFRYRSFIGIADTKERIQEVEKIVEENNIGLLIIDDVTCLVQDINDNKEADKFFKWLVALANNNNFAFVLTIHPNPKDPDFKPRGHIGSYALQKCESAYVIKKSPQDPSVRLITTDFSLTKTRNDSDMNEVAFSWNDERQMFCSADYERQPVTGNEKQEDYIQRFKEIFRGYTTKEVKSTDLVSSYHVSFGVGVRQARRCIQDAVDLGILIKEKKGKHVFYSYSIGNNDYSEVPF